MYGDKPPHDHRGGLRTGRGGERIEHGEPVGFIGAALQATGHERRRFFHPPRGDERLGLRGAGRGLTRSRQQLACALAVPARQHRAAREVRGAGPPPSIRGREQGLEQAGGERGVAGGERTLGPGEGGPLAQPRVGDRRERPVQRGDRIGARATARPPLSLQHQRVVRPAAARVAREH